MTQLTPQEQIQLLTDAKTLIVTRGWGRGVYAHDAATGGEIVDPECCQTADTCFCTLGALHAINNRDGYLPDADAVEFFMSGILGVNSTANWNDDAPDQQQVLNAFDTAILSLEKSL